ncbi:MAG: Maf family protein [Blautia sp.]
MKKLILASASPRRRELLEQIGAVFQICPSQREEVITGNHPADVVMELSRQKGKEVFDRVEGDVCVIGADTVVAIDHSILGKPVDEKDAATILQRLQGRTHEVYTGVTLLIREQGSSQIKSFYEKTEVEFYPVSPKEIRAYVKTGEPMDKAGAYGIQGKSAVFVKRIEGDYNNVVGLPVARVYQEAKNMGIDIKEWHE